MPLFMLWLKPLGEFRIVHSLAPWINALVSSPQACSTIHLSHPAVGIYSTEYSALNQLPSIWGSLSCRKQLAICKPALGILSSQHWKKNFNSWAKQRTQLCFTWRRSQGLGWPQQQLQLKMHQIPSLLSLGTNSMPPHPPKRFSCGF